jgi:hypothetical protein
VEELASMPGFMVNLHAADFHIGVVGHSRLDAASRM